MIKLQLEERRRRFGQPTLADMGAKPIPRTYLVTDIDYVRVQAALHLQAWGKRWWSQYECGVNLMKRLAL